MDHTSVSLSVFRQIAEAHLWSGSSSGRAVGYQVRGSGFVSQSDQVNFYCSPVPTQLGLLRSGESKGGEESKGKLPHNAVCQEHSRPYSWFPNAWMQLCPSVDVDLLSDHYNKV
ncbi:hypothetical protein PoB_001921700 [Plakobranchus ocellatus]|uniref:Uncharacterized protein n=1 Tax=Plakobranchus ocellatus TaxID=259542 RepID=A0AAV3ZE00_9GAST|nr:hypothetical protein PoB_001921700 [Plakobranchus ocellatus]